MDYSLSQALAYNMPESPTAVVIYDIMCQYGVHLRSRFEQSPFLHLPDGISIDGGIGLFHVHGHQDTCYPRFAPNFIPGTGRQDGEIMETLWAPLKLVSGSTRAMTAAHRRETLDDHMNDSNWKKTIGMGASPGSLATVKKNLTRTCRGKKKPDTHTCSQDALQEIQAGHQRIRG